MVAGALLLGYGARQRVDESYRDAGDIRSLVARPDSPAVADGLLTACCEVFDEWRVTKRYADETRPALATYGAPACWPHIRAVYHPRALVGQAAAWLRLGRVDRLIAYGSPEETDELAILEAVGFRELTRTERGWQVHPRAGSGSGTPAPEKGPRGAAGG